MLALSIKKRLESVFVRSFSRWYENESLNLHFSLLDAIEERMTMHPPSPEQFLEMRKVWDRCTKLEIGFWDMALDLH